ncbi:MAG: 2-keto-4-pentenoate hydratase, partial [bacterium]
NINKTAEFLLRNRLEHRIVDNIPNPIAPQSMQQAYLIQARLVSLMLDRYGSSTCGYKLACTNARVIKLLSVDGPLSGRMLSHSTHGSGAELNTDDFCRRIVELEFAFALGKDVPTGEVPYTANTITPYIVSFLPALEIVDHHYTDFTQVGGKALAADNAIHGASIIGSPVPDWQHVDLAKHSVDLLVNGRSFSKGNGQNVLDSPLNAMAWLANHLQSRGDSLKSGDLVTTGTACEIYNAKKGDQVLGDFGILGSVAARFV